MIILCFCNRSGRWGSCWSMGESVTIVMVEGHIYGHIYEWNRVYKLFNYDYPSRGFLGMKLVATSG